MLSLKMDERGLVVAVAQDRLTGEVRMVAWMNEAALRQTLETGRATFYSRSRAALWEKGETSGHRLNVRAAYIDCDADTVLLLVDPEGPSCHTGSPTCFFRRIADADHLDADSGTALPFLSSLEAELVARQTSSSSASYTKALLDAGAVKIGDKLREEAAELAAALAEESDARVLSEAGDVIYHLMVALRLRGLDVRDVLDALAQRAGVSGHEEKARRKGTRPVA